ncbi:MAG: hypothetical protein U0R44_04200 [Candidatus Micrarchaeia archaeon]
MELTKKDSYAKMISIYIKNLQDQQAYDLSKEFIQKFPGELISHLLLAESAFRLARYAEAKLEGRKALRYANSDYDLLFCSMVFASACFQLKDYIEGYKVLKEISAKRPVLEVEEALFAFSLAMKNEATAIQHMKNMLQINRQHALDLMKDYISNLPGEEPPVA